MGRGEAHAVVQARLQPVAGRETDQALGQGERAGISNATILARRDGFCGLCGHRLQQRRPDGVARRDAVHDSRRRPVSHSRRQLLDDSVKFVGTSRRGGSDLPRDDARHRLHHASLRSEAGPRRAIDQPNEQPVVQTALGSPCRFRCFQAVPSHVLRDLVGERHVARGPERDRHRQRQLQQFDLEPRKRPGRSAGRVHRGEERPEATERVLGGKHIHVVYHQRDHAIGRHVLQTLADRVGRLGCLTRLLGCPDHRQQQLGQPAVRPEVPRRHREQRKETLGQPLALGDRRGDTPQRPMEVPLRVSDRRPRPDVPPEREDHRHQTRVVGRLCLHLDASVHGADEGRIERRRERRQRRASRVGVPPHVDVRGPEPGLDLHPLHDREHPRWVLPRGLEPVQYVPRAIQELVDCIRRRGQRRRPRRPACLDGIHQPVKAHLTHRRVHLIPQHPPQCFARRARQRRILRELPEVQRRKNCLDHSTDSPPRAPAQHQRQLTRRRRQRQLRKLLGPVRQQRLDVLIRRRTRQVLCQTTHRLFPRARVRLADMLQVDPKVLGGVVRIRSCARVQSRCRRRRSRARRQPVPPKLEGAERLHVLPASELGCSLGR